LKAFTQGLHGSAAQMRWLRGDLDPQMVGVSGPNSVTTSMEVRLA
jgi:hypothetical protein